MRKTVLLLLTAIYFLTEASAQLAAGSYTINSALPTSGTNYASFTDAVTALSTGIAGPVIFNVASGSGPYNEQITIPAISGASATNTITINGNGTTLTFAASVSTQRTTLKLDGTDYLKIKNLTIVANGASYGFGLQIINDANNNTIDSCTVNISGTGLNYAGICINGNATLSYITNSLSDSNVISNNTITGGYYAVTVIGDPAARISGNKVLNNTVLNASFGGIYVSGNDHLLIDGNDLSRPTLAALNSYYGINLGNGNINTVVNRNKVHNFFGSLTGSSAYSAYGFATQSVATAGNENIFSNNIVYDMNGDGTQYGLYNTGGSYTSYYYNTVTSDNQSSVSGNTYGLYQTNAATNIIFKNNLVSITRTGTGTKYALYMNTTATTYTSENNNLYVSAPAGSNYTGRAAGVNYATLATWQTGTSNDLLSLQTPPLFTSSATGNLLPNSSILDNHAVVISGITADINGTLRSTSTPDIGAFEFTAPVISISGNNNVCTGTTTTFTGTPSGGTWSSSNTAAATISSSGVVTALTAGTTVITYTTGTGFINDTISITATPIVANITGSAANLCAGDTTTLHNVTPGGAWTSSNQFMATINASTGLVTAIGTGNVIFTYTVLNGSCTASDTFSLNSYALPQVPALVVPNGGNLCSGSTFIVSNNTLGGTWTTTTPSLITITPSGNSVSILAGPTSGQANITYTVTNAGGCATVVSSNIVIQSVPVVSNITGDTTICLGASSTLVNTTPNGIWSNSNAVISVTQGGIITGLNAGVSQVRYTVTNSNSCSTQVSRLVTVFPPPIPVVTANGNVLSTTANYATYQWAKNNAAITGATSQTYTTTVSDSFKVTVTDTNGCTGTSANVYVQATGINNLSLEAGGIKMFPNPSQEILHIQLPAALLSNARFSIVDQTGKQLMQQSIDHSTIDLNVSHYPTGVYFIRFQGATTSYNGLFNVSH